MNQTCYMVTFYVSNDLGVFKHYCTFYVNEGENPAEAIMEYQDELEEELKAIVVKKDIKEVDCK